MNKLLFIFAFIFSCSYAANNVDPENTEQQQFEQWKIDFSQRATNVGIRADTISLFNKQAQLYKQAIVSDQNQAEFSKFIWDYINSAVSNKRIIFGKQKYQEHSDLLDKIQSHFAVPKSIVIAIWGMETSYGNNLGSVPLVSSMATLGFEGRRQQFFENQLIDFLALYDAGDIVNFNALGSWAGGMGHTQFIPSTYRQFAVDFDGNGHRDLFQITDALASTANYLSKIGYNDAEPWGGEAIIGQNFNYLLANDNEYRSLVAWQKLGVRLLNVPDQMQYNAKAKLFVPAGATGPKFLLFKNFDIIKKYNNSDAYALAVGLLSKEIVKQNGLPMLTVSWPSNAKQLNRDNITIMQHKLVAKGFDVGEIDGIWGNSLRRAIQLYQQQQGYVADGFLTDKLFDEIVAK